MPSPSAGFDLWKGRFAKVFPPISPHGKKIVLLVWVGVFFLFLFFGVIFALITLVPAVWCIYFFRDPPRYTPAVDGALIAPADGQIILIAKDSLPKTHPFSGLLPQEKMHHVAIFMDLFDCHVNRSPISGKLLRMAYKKGCKKAADSSFIEDNEQQSFLLQDEEKRPYVLIQIAGQIARRIVADVSAPCLLKAGEKVGMILFGSRVDVYFPLSHRPLVVCHQRTIAGETLIALAPPPSSQTPKEPKPKKINKKKHKV